MWGILRMQDVRWPHLFRVFEPTEFVCRFPVVWEKAECLDSHVLQKLRLRYPVPGYQAKGRDRGSKGAKGIVEA